MDRGCNEEALLRIRFMELAKGRNPCVHSFPKPSGRTG